ncbi:MAG: carbohydrate-binding domain-containing protein [Bacteroidaceae bacterium]|nr:carbohydrate-binding domain-containing protein [Bacteroidaceae bacterium]
MKKFAIFGLALWSVMTLQAQTLNVKMGQVTYQIPAEQAGVMPYENFNEEQTSSLLSTVTILNKVYPLSDVDCMFVSDDEVLDDAVDVVYDGEEATVKVAGNIAQYLAVAVNGAHVSIVQSEDVQRELVYTLSGSSQNGSFYMDGEYKISLVLNGLTLHNPDSAAVNIRDGKRISVELTEGTVSTLSDGKGGTQKACFAVKGHTEFKGAGTLWLTGNSAHAFWGKEYVEVKKTCGGIFVEGAVGDGFNVNQYFQQNGSAVTIKGVGDDGIQVSYKTDDDGVVETDAENTGSILIKGGTLSVTTTGDGSKGLKAEADVTVTDGDVNVSQSGGLTFASKDEEDSDAKSYVVYVSLPTSGGGGGFGGGSSRAWTTVNLYTADGTFVQQLTNTTTRSSGYSTVTFYSYDFKTAQSGQSYYFQSANYTSRGQSYTIRSATFSAPTSGSDIYYSISNSYTTSGSTRTYSLTNVTSTYGGTSSGADELDASYSSGIKCVNYVQSGGTVKVTETGAASRGISATSITTDGGTLIVESSSGGYSGTSDDFTAKGLLADSSIALNSGTVTVTMTGAGGKGIKSKGTYTQGLSDGTGPLLTVTTSGSRFGESNTGGGGWGGPGGGWGESSGGSAKAIKIQGTATLYGGETHVKTSTDGAEGLETKQGNITFEGGHHYFECYDDCINSAYKIIFNGGITLCYSTGNDAIDSNYGSQGAITIGDGCVISYTTRGDPEEGFDCDNNSYIQITGKGYAVSAGGSQGGGGGGWGSSGNSISGAVQGYKFYTDGCSFSSGRYYTLLDSSKNNLLTFSFKAGLSSKLSLITAKGMTSGQTYEVKYATSAPTDATDSFEGVYIGASLVGTGTGFSFTAQ